MTDAAKDALAAGGLDIVYAVGPVPMMRAVVTLTKPLGVRTIVSLNPVMVDGTGMCCGCGLVPSIIRTTTMLMAALFVGLFLAWCWGGLRWVGRKLGLPSPTCRLQDSSRRSGCVPAELLKHRQSNSSPNQDKRPSTKVHL